MIRKVGAIMGVNKKLKRELIVFESIFNHLKARQPVSEEDIKTMEDLCDNVIKLDPHYEYLKQNIKELKVKILTPEERKIKEMVNTFWQRFQNLKDQMPLNEEQKKQRKELFDVYLEEIIKLDPGQWHLREIYCELIDLPPGAYI